ncbi:transcriptional regulator, AraC family [Beutenbergia cavernae DSM 12333]|uniref:Transcriptional regulator, AraC family n=1 Tax=Beutenbergia cavernae (strain ATCC BAA-8 / DSM 12333 / CCUG 43141 / JCM 11478 / NBRC 16432 / NCIMB 13614 / HKI 0122) TaxID=471853 RepID=C5C317_BEUC1|nr:AraC family transcriptional regulator [Beutenbergia cavernae]ACQ81861.1 transcriptional regulator, AraC family [Beutenbergia cavernae DSM 12333]
MSALGVWPPSVRPGEKGAQMSTTGLRLRTPPPDITHARASIVLPRPSRAEAPRAQHATAPVVVYAARTRLTYSEQLWFPRVESRMFFCVVAGSGAVRVNGTELELHPKVIVGMPWGHRVAYLPSRRDPLVINSAHLIVRHRLDHDLELCVPHRPDEPLAGVEWRSDAPLGVPDEPFLTDAEERPGLAMLLDYIAHTWTGGHATPTIALHLGALLVSELNRGASSRQPHEDPSLPPRLRRAMAWARGHLYLSVTIEDLCSAADVSPSTLGRLFRQHLGASPLSWVHDLKMARAEELLVESMFTIRQVSRQVGFADPHYFARWFSKRHHMAPSEWRRLQGKT